MRLGLVAEGPTDRIVIEAAVRAILADRRFVLTQLQPEQSAAFGPLGTGWAGVLRWCEQSAARGKGRLHDDALAFAVQDILILHLDADVAGVTYESANVTKGRKHGALPCAHPCPPPRATTDALRSVLLTWCGVKAVPAGVVLCVPSKSIEAWVVQALFPNDKVAVGGGLECYDQPEARFGTQPKKSRIAKTRRDYQARAADLTAAWGRVRTSLTEAARFEEELKTAIRALPLRK